ncbi:hypothetical protein L596_013230 [Steinernema carpocapsae]|uniref:UPAR/Ly6 domain-containing protein n=1 Tax=Steinernema carpocapsae TaxID=34508 RepID=A0A4U5NZP5_STECR|nr:hypothetical protein L596_013230 [Steinernema carpocapsae]
MRFTLLVCTLLAAFSFTSAIRCHFGGPNKNYTTRCLETDYCYYMTATYRVTGRRAVLFGCGNDAEIQKETQGYVCSVAFQKNLTTDTGTSEFTCCNTDYCNWSSHVNSGEMRPKNFEANQTKVLDDNFDASPADKKTKSFGRTYSPFGSAGVVLVAFLIQ